MKSRFLVLSALVLAVDQWSKWWIEATLEQHERLPVVPGFFDLVHVQNTGIAFGLFPAGRELLGTLLLTALGCAALTVVSVYFRQTSEREPLLLLSLSLVLGGAVGNLVDRILLRAVTDFLDVYIGAHHWPAFNVADSGVTVGIVLMLAYSFWPSMRRKRSGRDEPWRAGPGRHIEVTTMQAPAAAAGERIDQYLARALDQPRNRVQNLLRSGLVTVDGARPKPSYLLRGGEEIAYRIPAPPATGPVPEAGPISVLHLDEHILVVDKPAGLIVHPGAGVPGGTLVNRLLHHHPEIAGVGSAERPGIVHRLDIGTSGALAVARTDTAYRFLSRAFAEREVGKVYLAVVYGRPEPLEGTIELPIGRHPTARTRMAVVRESRGGRPATTLYRVLAFAAGVSLLEVTLQTGRTHQIRVHCKAVGHPLIGDPSYGEQRWRGQEPALRRPLREFPRPALHALRLTLPSLAGGPPHTSTAPVPEDLRALCAACGLDGELPTAERASRGR